MKRIAIYCVTYNTYTELEDFRMSVEQAALNAKQKAEVALFVADNTEHNIKEIPTHSENIAISVFAYNKNLGYFGAISKMMGNTPTEKFDYVIVSNVDVKVMPDMLLKLAEKETDSSTGWIAPQIYSELEQRDRNPSITSRYSKAKLKMLYTMYRFPILNLLYTKTLYKRKKILSHKPGRTYAGHGSFIILTASYIHRCGKINYPVFLYGEELYLAENCRNKSLNVVYSPELVITDKEHASTKSLSNKFYYRCNKEAIAYIIKTFY